MSRVVHFELPSTNSDVSRAFYTTVLGWKFEKWDGPMDYWMITTGEASEPGINGGLGGAANEFNATVNTVDVTDLDETLRLALANGGQVIMPKDAVPGVGWLAYIREPGGAVLGLMQEDIKAGM